MNLALIRRYALALVAGGIGYLLMASGATLFEDWRFLHAARLTYELQQKQQPVQQVGPGHVEPGPPEKPQVDAPAPHK